MLSIYSWPGNVRELSNVIQKSLIFNRGAPISPDDITQAISDKTKRKEDDEEAFDQAIQQHVRRKLTDKTDDISFDGIMDHFASILISEALNLTGGNRSRTAKLLGLSRPTLHSKIEKYKLKLETLVRGNNA